MSIIPATVTRRVALSGLELQRKSPALLLGGGIVGIVGTVVLASRATLRLGSVLDEANAKLDDIRELRSQPSTPADEKEFKKAQVLFTLEAAVNIAKLYGPALLVGTASIAMLVSSHNILNKRNVALTAAYSALDKAYRSYRDRVVEELGAEKDRDFAYGVKTERITQVNPETGKKVSVEKKTATDVSPYGRLYRVDNPNHSMNPDGNVAFLRMQQNYLNDRLQRRGYLLLNEVYKTLGLTESSDGCVVGWVKDSVNGDGYVDFGLFNPEDSAKMLDLMMDSDNEIWLDFNVDGLVFDQVDRIKQGKKL